MESTCHKRVVIRRVAKYHQLGTAKGILLFGSLCCLKDDFSHQLHGVHVDSGLCGTNVYRAAHPLSACKCPGNGTDQKLFCGGHSFAYKSSVSADKVYSNLFCSFVKSLGDGHKVLCGLAGSSAYQTNRGYGNSFIYNGNSVLGRNLLSGCYQILSISGNFVINFFI